MRLADILTSLQDTDTTLRALGDLADAHPSDETVLVNIDAVTKRRKALERRLGARLRQGQLDLIRLTMHRRSDEACPAGAMARSLVVFQDMVTAVFDAIRDGPKRDYAPSAKNAELSAFRIATTPVDTQTVSLTLPNERLLAVRSELDLAIEIVLALFRLRTEADLRRFGEKIGIASIARLHEWAANSARERLQTTIEWRKAEDDIRTVAISHVEAAALRQLIELSWEERIESVDLECQLIGLDEARRTFRLQVSDAERIEGTLADEFPRGRHWTMNAWLFAGLVRATRVSYATGAVTTRWSLTALAPRSVGG